jgi:hypothetical protein
MTISIHQCQCPQSRESQDRQVREQHHQMNLFLSRLDEQQRRWYAALESKRIGHGGDTNGQKTLLRIVPSKKFAVAVFANSGEGNTLTGEIVDLATRQCLGLAEPEAHPLDLPEDQLKTYLGQYDASGSFCEIVFRDGGLVLNVTPKGGSPRPTRPRPSRRRPFVSRSMPKIGPSFWTSP